jgi:hypothetical protein
MDDRAIIRSFESGFDKRVIALTIVAILVVLGLVAVVVRGFHGRDISQGASAMTKAVAAPAETAKTNSGK